MVKAILQFTAEMRPGYDHLTQGAGFLNTLGAVRLSQYFATAKKGDHYPDMRAWSKHILWGNRRVSGGVLTPGGTAWALNIVWGDSLTPAGLNIVWGENCDNAACSNIVWGNNFDNIVWGNDCGGADCDNVVWGNTFDNVVWGNAEGLDNIVWGNNGLLDNVVWGNSAADADISWGSSAYDDPLFGDDLTEVESFNPELFDALFEVAPLTTTQTGGQQ
jgi:hypothetical protein